MVKRLSALVTFLFLYGNITAQYLYGISGQGFKALDLSTKQQTILIPGLSLNLYQGHTTSDVDYRFFGVAQGISSTAADTLVTIDITNNTVTKDTITQKSIYFPEYSNGKIYGIGDMGIVSYDLATHQLQVLEPNIKAQSVIRAGFNHSANEYIFLKKGPVLLNVHDTLYAYNVNANSITTDTIITGSYCFDYSPGNNTAYMINSLKGVKGIYQYNVATKTYSLAAPTGNGSGIFSNIATTDPVNNGYFCIAAGNSGSRDSIFYYSAVTGQLTKIDIIKNSLQCIEYFTRKPVISNIEETTDAAILFSVYPNPAKDFITIQLHDQSSVYVTISDIQGRVLMNRNIQSRKSVSMDISSLPKGNYVLSVTAGTNIQTRAFSKL